MMEKDASVAYLPVTVVISAVIMLVLCITAINLVRVSVFLVGLVAPSTGFVLNASYGSSGPLCCCCDRLLCFPIVC